MVKLPSNDKTDGDNVSEVKCPECGSKMHRMGKVWSGRKQVQRYRCPKCGRTYAPSHIEEHEKDY